MVDTPDLARALDLQPHPEGGWFRGTWRSPSTDEGESSQVVVPAGVWQRSMPSDADALVSCVVSPGFDFEDLELASA